MIRSFQAALAAALLCASLTSCGEMVSLPPIQETRIEAPAQVNPLAGLPLRYLIGAGGAVSCKAGEIAEPPYGEIANGDCIKIAYVNLFDEKNTGQYGPYLKTSDTAAEYNEGQIDPRGPGWDKNLREQFQRATANGFTYAELDNPDAYKAKDVIGAIDLADSYSLKVIAKNPGISDLGEDFTPVVAHRNVMGIIVEKGAGSPKDMDDQRKRAGKPDLPVWFVFFGANGKRAAQQTATQIKAGSFPNMFVTYSSAGEYVNSIDVK